jgi:hypothetical protein
MAMVPPSVIQKPSLGKRSKNLFIFEKSELLEAKAGFIGFGLYRLLA